MKRFALFLGIAAALAASCSIQEEDFVAPQQDDVIFYASFEQPSEGTRVYANDNLYLRWTADDRVSIFNKITYNQQYKFLGETGDNSGGFNRIDAAEFVTGNPISHVVSVYPYQEGTKISEEEVLTLTLPAEQHYAENTFGLGANTMVSVSEDNVLQYKNVGGYLRISLFGKDVNVSSIILKGNNGEKLAGSAYVTMPLEGNPRVNMAYDVSDMITLVCDSPVALGATTEGCKDFWFVVPPCTFSKGFTIMVTQTSGAFFKKETTKSITIERSNVLTMSPIEVESTQITPVPEAIDLGLPSGIRWASFNLGASKPEEYGDYYAWGETEPYYNNLDPLIWKDGKEAGYDWPSYKWCHGAERTLSKYCFNPDYGYNGFTDSKNVLDSDDDVARFRLGDNWRMPTNEDFEELRRNCKIASVTQNGVKGNLYTSYSTGNSIFFPFADQLYKENILNQEGVDGYYWSSSLSPYQPCDAYQLTAGFLPGIYCFSRCHGLPVRPVCD